MEITRVVVSKDSKFSPSYFQLISRLRIVEYGMDELMNH